MVKSNLEVIKQKISNTNNKSIPIKHGLEFVDKHFGHGSIECVFINEYGDVIVEYYQCMDIEAEDYEIDLESNKFAPLRKFENIVIKKIADKLNNNN